MTCSDMKPRNPYLALHWKHGKIDLDYQFLTLAADYFDIHIDIVHSYAKPWWWIKWIPHKNYWMFNITRISNIFKQRIHFKEVVIQYMISLCPNMFSLAKLL